LFDREPQDYAKLNSLHLDARLREQARDNLRSADAQEAVLFMVRASNANLYTKVPQLRSSYLSEPGIERVFTRPGCERFFDRRTVNGKHWWKCVLGVEEPKDPINLEEEYRRNYLHAWGNWLRDLSLKPSQKEDKADALTKVGDTLDGLLREPHAELMQVVKLVGIGREEVLVPKSLRPVRQSGCAGWLRKQAVQLNKNVLDLALPKACSQAHVPFELFAQLTARPVDGKDLEEESGLHTIDLFRKYMTAAEVLRTTLYKIRNTTINNRGSQSLKLVADTMGGTGELWALDESRRRLIDNLDGRMRMGATGINVRDSGLHQILLQIERDVWMALLPIAAKTIDERWKVEVFEPWSQLKAKHKAYEVQDSDRVLDIVDFGQKVKEFHRQVLSPLYQSGDSSRCVLQEMAIPFKDALPLLTGACAMLQKFIRVTEITDSQKTLGATGSALKRRPSNADVVPPASCPGLLARAVRLDDGEQLYSCSMASSLCQHEPSGSKRPSLSVSWGANWSFTQHLLGDDYNLFLKKFGRIEGNRLTFVLPTQNVPGQCPGIRVIFVLQPVPGSGAPSKPDNDWKSVDLPTSLIR
jgi:hypothetical protein